MAHHWPPTLFSLCFLRFNSLSSWNDVAVLAVVQFQVENCLEHCQHLLDVHTSHSTCSSSSASPRQFTAIKTANYAFCAPRRGSGCCMQQLHFMIAAPCSRSNPLLLHLLPLLIFLLHSFSSPLISSPAHSLCLLLTPDKGIGRRARFRIGVAASENEIAQSLLRALNN